MQNSPEAAIKNISAYLKYKGYNVTHFDKKVFRELLESHFELTPEDALDSEVVNSMRGN